MSAEFSNLLLSNFLPKKSQRLCFFLKIQDQLVPVTFQSNKTVKSLKLFLEKKFQIPPKSHFLIQNGYALKDTDKIGQKISEKKTISLNFRLRGGMIDPPFSPPLLGLEVILIDNSNKLISGTLFDPLNNPNNLPSNLVCRIYTNFGCGTGFGVKTARGETLIITAKHVINSPFGQATLIAACFEYNQYKFGGMIIEDFYCGLHSCRPSIQELEIVDFNFSSNGSQRDPITKRLYSIHDDIIALRPTGKCICGRPNAPPVIDRLEITTTPSNGSPIVLLGYPGNFTDKKKVFPVDVSDSEFKSAKLSFLRDALLFTEGVILEKNTMSAISASSVGGMSGSPLLWLNEGEWKISGMLVGGPAVRGHRRLLEILSAFKNNDDAACSALIEAMKNSRSQRFKKIGKLLSENHNIFEDLVKTLYYNQIEEESERLLAKGKDPKEILNHNLVYDCSIFINSLIS